MTHPDMTCVTYHSLLKHAEMTFLTNRNRLTGRSCRDTIWEVVTQLSHFLAVTTSLPDRIGVFQDFLSKWCFHKR